tara:strand:+ start:111 stop:761 length:651 start_codon:yes stop_codon:yes gene_type:complete
MNPLPLFFIIVTLPLLLGGCGGDKKESVTDVKLEEPVAETKPVEEVPLNPYLKYEIKGDAVTITAFNTRASGELIIPAAIEGKSVTSIGLSAFWDCRLTSITIGNGVTSIGRSAFCMSKSLTSVKMPDSVTSIGRSAFNTCTSLTSITIPDSVTSIGSNAFKWCESLTAVTFLGDAPKASNDVFDKAAPTIYRKSEAKGWGDTFAGRPVKLISEKP